MQNSNLYFTIFSKDLWVFNYTFKTFNQKGKQIDQLRYLIYNLQLYILHPTLQNTSILTLAKFPTYPLENFKWKQININYKYENKSEKAKKQL
jgi:hypothetical protein